MPGETSDFGLIGFGLYGKHCAAVIDGTDGARLASIAVKSEASRTAAREAHPQTAVHGDYREMLAAGPLDAVMVTVPNHLHHEVGMAVLESGRHLLLEKPMALRLDHCDELIAAATSRGLVLAIGHELRLSSQWGGVKRLIDDGAIGRPQHALIELSRFPYRPGAEGWRYDFDRVGNWILEEPIHFFDLARWFLSAAGEPVSLFAQANSRHADRPELRDNFSAIVNFPGDAYAVVSQTLAAFDHSVTAKVVGTEGAIIARWSAADARSGDPVFDLRYGLGDDVTEVPFTTASGELVELAEEIAVMVQSVQEGTPPHCTGRDGRAATLLCLAAQWSVETGTPVRLDEYADI